MSEQISVPEDLAKDLAGTYHPHHRQTDRQSSEIDRDFDQVMRDGYIVLENLLNVEHLERIRAGCDEVLNNHKTGRNNFEGLNTQRVYNALAKTRVLDALATHPRILGLLDKLFAPNYLLSSAQVLNVQPGEAAQMLHIDDGFYQIPRPRPPLGAATVWAIDDFTEHNGATRLIPGSHRWGDDRTADEDSTIKAVMPAGSVVFFVGTLWHGAGANQASDPRLAITCQYCEAYLRQQENFALGVPKSVVKQLSPELRSLIGYSIHPPFMGCVNGMHPLRLLEND